MGNDASKMMNDDINNRRSSVSDESKTMAAAADTQADIEEFEQKIETFFSALAANGEDHLDYGKIISKMQESTKSKFANNFFKKIDCAGSGFITKQEIKNFFMKLKQ